jgi:glycosyltransferase involved in cell wall biosynthesis
VTARGSTPAPSPPPVRLRGRLVVISHKVCWPSAASPSGFATTGGFPMQMAALAELFDETVLCVPVDERAARGESNPLSGPRQRVVALDPLPANRRPRRLRMLPWVPGNAARVARQVRGADVVHAVIPGDVGSLGLVLAPLFGRRLLVRYCGSWEVTRSVAERAWKAYMRRRASSRDVMVATGAADGPAPTEHPAIHWIFATTLSDAHLDDLARRAVTAQRSGLVSAARQVTEKGTAQAIRALRYLHDWGHPVTLDVVGDGADLPRLRALARDLGLGDHVTFHGQLAHDRVLDRLLAAEVLLHPTLREGMPKVVVEALACGLPVVCSPVPAVESLVRATGLGAIVERDDVTGIASAARALLTDRGRLARVHTEAPRVARGLSLDRWRDTLASFMAEAWPELVRAPTLGARPS